MGLLSTLGAKIAARSIVRTGERLITLMARDARNKKKGYLQGYADAKAGKRNRYV